MLFVLVILVIVMVVVVAVVVVVIVVVVVVITLFYITRAIHNNKGTLTFCFGLQRVVILSIYSLR